MKIRQTVWRCDACGAKITADGNRIPDGWRIIGKYVEDIEPLQFCDDVSCIVRQRQMMDERRRKVSEHTINVSLGSNFFSAGGIREMYDRLGRVLAEIEKVGLRDTECSCDPWESGGCVDISFKLLCSAGDAQNLQCLLQDIIDGDAA